MNLNMFLTCAEFEVKISVSSFYKENNFKPCLTKQLLNMFKLWYERGISRSLWENLDLGRVYRPHCVPSVLTPSVKILPYLPPARLIRANYFTS